MKPKIGRIVHFVQKDKNGNNIHLPAIIVAIWSDTCVNLQVFTDGTNSEPNLGYGPSIKWFTSSTFDDSNEPQIASWHWPEKE